MLKIRKEKGIMSKSGCFIVCFIFAVCLILMPVLKAVSQEDVAKGEMAVSDEKILAVIGDEKITLDEFNKIVSQLPEQYITKANEDPKQVLEMVIEQKLLLKEAHGRNLENTEDFKKRLDFVTGQILIQELFSNEIQQKASISEEEVKQYYESHKSEFEEPEKVKASHILVDTEKEAKNILKELKKGTDFAILAKEKSKCPSKEQGGDLGFFNRGRMAKEFEDAAFSLEPGKISDVVKTQFGYHIIKVEEKQPPSVKSYDEIKDSLKQILAIRKQQQIINELVQSLKNATEISINEELLKSGTPSDTPSAPTP